MRASSFVIAGTLVVVALACAPRAPFMPPSEERHALVDCPWVAEGCVEDQDGCSEKEGHGRAPDGWSGPTPELSAGCGDAIADVAMLVDVAAQVRQKQALSKVRIIAPSPRCGAAVRAELERLGAAATRSESVVRPNARFVRFEVAAWNDARCP